MRVVFQLRELAKYLSFRCRTRHFDVTNNAVGYKDAIFNLCFIYEKLENSGYFGRQIFPTVHIADKKKTRCGNRTRGPLALMPVAMCLTDVNRKQ